MSSEARMNADQKKLEAALARLELPEVPLDRDELMYQSGWAAARSSMQAQADDSAPLAFKQGSGWIWQAAALVSSATAAILMVALAIQSGVMSGSQREPSVANVDTAVADTGASGELVSVEPGGPNGRSEVPVTERNRGIDLVERILDLPMDASLTSGISFQSFDAVSAPGENRSQYVSTPGGSEPTLGHRQLMWELLPEPRGARPSWRLLTF